MELRRQGWRVNRKRVRRLWRDEGLRVPARKRKRASRGPVVVGAFCPVRPNVLWAKDFQFDQTADGRNLKLLNIIDELTREALSTDVERPITADMLVANLERFINRKGTPKYLRFNNGPESSPESSPTGQEPATSLWSSPNPDVPGKTAGSNYSTADCAMNYSTANNSRRFSKPK